MDVVIRKETRGDECAIAALIVQAFGNAPHRSGTEHLIVAALRESGRLSLSLVAHLDNELVGHLAISTVRLSSGDQGWFGLGPVAVLPEQQRRGFGTLLITEALAMLRNDGAAGCVVLGEPSYYGRFGFCNEHALVLPGAPAEYFQSICFSPSKPRAQVRYDDAFDLATDAAEQ